MPLDICPILESDIEAWIRLIFAASQDNPVSKLKYPVPATPSLIAWTVQNTIQSWGKDPTARRQVKDTETGEMIRKPIQPQDQWSQQADRSHGAQPYLYLPSLVTHPKHHRRGAATLLLKWGIDQASKQNLPINLTASPAGISLYKKFGFQPLYETAIDLTPVGLSQHCVQTGMILPAPFPSGPVPAVGH